MFDEADEVRTWLADPPTVTAILVSHNGATWLPKVLASLSAMDYAPTAWRAVDVSSTDGSGEMLRDAFGADRLSYAPSGTGFGAAVTIGLEAAPKSAWIWLLHDDCAVQESTLAALLDEALIDERTAIVGPKVREWPSLRRLLEVGITLSGTAVRVTGLEPGEPDAGQHDRARDVLAVGTAGMLIRRDAWEDLGGFDDTLKLYFDDLDLGWRAARAGYRVRTAPKAVIFHAEASARGSRRQSAGDVGAAEQRRAALFVALANARPRTFWWQWVRLFFGSLLRALGFLVAKAPEEAGDELLALKNVYLHPRTLHAARAKRRRQARRSPADVAHLFPSPWLPYQHGLDSLRDVVATIMKPTTVEGGGRRTSNRRLAAFDPEHDSTQNADEGPAFFARRPWLTVVLVLVVLSLIAARGLLTGGQLHGGALLPAPETAGGWWQLFFERWHDVGIGSDIAAPPYVLVLALVSLPVWFAPDLVLSILMLGAVPLAALTAHRLSRRWFASGAVRMLWAITYAVLVVATGAVASGRIGTVVAMIVAPVVVGAALALMQRPSWQAGLRLGLWLALATAFAPIVFLLAAVVAIAAAVGAAPKQRRALAMSIVVCLLLVGNWTWQRVVVPFRWWWEAGNADAGNGSLHVDAPNLLLGRVGGSGAAPAWLSIGILVLAVAALVSGRRTTAVTWSWVVASTGFIAMVAGNAMTFSPPPGPDSLEVWNGVGAVVWLGGLTAAAMFVADDLAARPLRMPYLTAFARVAIVVALVAPLGTGAWWLVHGVDDSLTRSAPDEVPAYLAARSGQSTLVVDGDIAGGISYDVVAGAGMYLGQEAVQPSTTDSAAVTKLLASLLSNPTNRGIQALSGLGISAIYAPAEVDGELARRLDAAPGLNPSGSDDPESRVWLIDAEAPPTEHGGSYARWVAAGLHLALIMIAIILTAPVRQRRRQL